MINQGLFPIAELHPEDLDPCEGPSEFVCDEFGNLIELRIEVTA